MASAGDGICCRSRGLVLWFLITTKVLLSVALPNLPTGYKRLSHPQLDSKHCPSPWMSPEGGGSSLGEEWGSLAMHSLKKDGSLCDSRCPSLGRQFSKAMWARQVQKRRIFFLLLNHAIVSLTQSHCKTPKREKKYAKWFWAVHAECRVGSSPATEHPENSSAIGQFFPALRRLILAARSLSSWSPLWVHGWGEGWAGLSAAIFQSLPVLRRNKSLGMGSGVTAAKNTGPRVNALTLVLTQTLSVSRAHRQTWKTFQVNKRS